MKTKHFLRLLGVFIGMYFISLQANALSCSDPFFSFDSVPSNDQFSELELDKITEFTIVDLSNRVSVRFSGGYASEALSPGSFNLYSWAVRSFGAAPQGESKGEGSLYLLPTARNIELKLQFSHSLIVRIQMMDNNGALLKEFSLSNEEFFEFDSYHDDDINSHISEIKIIIDGGDGEVTLSDLFYFTRGDCGGGSIDLFSLSVLFLILVLSLNRHKLFRYR